MNSSFTTFLTFIIFFISLNCFAGTQVFPTRVILSDKTRVSTISVRNKNKQTTKYTIKAVFYRMSSNGSMTMVSDAQAKERSLTKYLRFSPRRLSLKAGEEQVVRIMLKSTSKLLDGDYRAHLRILPNIDVPEDSKRKSKGANMKIFSRIAVSISVLYYKGETKMKTSLSNFKIQRDGNNNSKYKFSVKMKNIGNTFSIGNFKLYRKSKDGEKEQIGIVKGISNYIHERDFNLSITPLKDINLTNEKVELVFEGPKYFNSPVIATIESKI